MRFADLSLFAFSCLIYIVTACAPTRSQLKSVVGQGPFTRSYIFKITKSPDGDDLVTKFSCNLSKNDPKFDPKNCLEIYDSWDNRFHLGIGLSYFNKLAQKVISESDKTLTNLNQKYDLLIADKINAEQRLEAYSLKLQRVNDEISKIGQSNSPLVQEQLVTLKKQQAEAQENINKIKSKEMPALEVAKKNLTKQRDEAKIASDAVVKSQMAEIEEVLRSEIVFDSSAGPRIAGHFKIIEMVHNAVHSRCCILFKSPAPRIDWFVDNRGKTNVLQRTTNCDRASNAVIVGDDRGCVGVFKESVSERSILGIPTI